VELIRDVVAKQYLSTLLHAWFDVIHASFPSHRWNLSEMEEHWRAALEQRKKILEKFPIEERSVHRYYKQSSATF
jgi:hypothetical protein